MKNLLFAVVTTFSSYHIIMGCGSSSTSHNDSTHHNNDIDNETVDMRKTSMTGGYGMDFFGEMNNELVIIMTVTMPVLMIVTVTVTVIMRMVLIMIMILTLTGD